MTTNFDSATMQHVMIPPLTFPWPKPEGEYSHYQTNGPAERTRLTLHGIEFVVTPTKETGIHSGRTRFLVECWTCSTAHFLRNAVVHPATTGPSSLIEAHLQEAHGFKVTRNYPA